MEKHDGKMVPCEQCGKKVATSYLSTHKRYETHDHLCSCVPFMCVCTHDHLCSCVPCRRKHGVHVRRQQVKARDLPAQLKYKVMPRARADLQAR